MENKIPQKSFDAQMHIIRDVHFDVDKYKVGELYVIKYKTPNALTIDGKIVGKLTKVERDALTFDIFEKCPLESIPEHDMKNHYRIETLVLSIDLILRDRIEVERLLTETESIVYLTSIIPKVCAEELIPKPIDEEPVLADKYKGDLSHFIIPNSLACNEKYFHSDGTLKNIDMGEKHQSLMNELADPRMLRQHTKNDEESESAVDTNINRLNYICRIPGRVRDVSFIKEGGSFACELFDRFEESIKVTLTRGETVISFRASLKNVTANENTISMRSGNGTIKIVLHKDSFYKIFDEICFEG